MILELETDAKNFVTVFYNYASAIQDDPKFALGCYLTVMELQHKWLSMYEGYYYPEFLRLVNKYKEDRSLC